MAFVTNLPQEKPPLAHVYTIPEHVPRGRREVKKIIRLSQNEHEGSCSREKARDIARQTLTNYSKQADLALSLKNFAKKTLQLDSNHFEIKETDDIGYSGEKVYLVWGTKVNRSLGALKVFKEDSHNFFPEVFSLQFLSGASIPSFASPKIEALGKCSLEDNSYFLLYETAAPGCSFMRHYKNSLPVDILEKGMHKCGYTLARLHGHASGKIQKIPEDFEKRTREYLEKTIENLKKYPQPGIDVEKLRQLFELSIKEIQSEDIPTAVIHGDTKLENVFYDPETGAITWIDPPKLSESIHASGSPLGIPAKDVYSFIADIEYKQVMFCLDDQQHICSKKLIPDEDIPKLLDAFCKGYQDGGGRLPTKKQLNFFSLASLLYFAADSKILDPNCSIPEPLKSIKKYRLEKTLSDLKSRLKGFDQGL